MPRLSSDEFSNLVLSYLGEVTAYARSLTRSDWEADDLVQGTYERAFRAQRDLRESARCRAWLFRIARNLHIDGIRASAARPEMHLVDSSHSFASDEVVSPDTVERMSARDLEDALNRLPEEQRQVVLLCDLWGFRYEEISEIVGAPIGTVRSRIARGRVFLSNLLVASGHQDRRRGRP